MAVAVAQGMRREKRTVSAYGEQQKETTGTWETGRGRRARGFRGPILILRGRLRRYSTVPEKKTNKRRKRVLENYPTSTELN